MTEEKIPYIGTLAILSLAIFIGLLFYASERFNSAEEFCSEKNPCKGLDFSTKYNQKNIVRDMIWINSEIYTQIKCPNSADENNYCFLPKENDKR